MSDFGFEIKADPSDANKAIAGVETGLDRLKDKGSNVFSDSGRAKDAQGRFLAAGKAAGEAGNAMERAASQASGLFEVLEAYAGLHAVEAVLDGYTEIGNKIRAVTETQENFNGVMNETYDIAQSTRQSWGETASSFQRLSNATRGLGLSQRDALDLQKELAQATALSGATAQEAAMTQRELMHAFETGNLTMREWKVIQRDAPALVNELKKASGKTGAELAEMAHKGQLSASLLIDWFGKAKESIAEKFGRLIPTISDDLTMLKNAAEKFFGEAGEGAGVMQALGAATRFLVEHFDTLGKIILGVIEPLVALFIIEKIIGLIRALGVAIAANPLGALLLAITVGISLLRQFGDQWSTGETVMSKAGKTAVTVGDYLSALWDVIVKTKDAIVEFVKDGWNLLKEAFDDGIDTGGIGVSLRSVLVLFGSFVDAGIGIFRFLGDSIITIFGGIPIMIAASLQDVINAFLKAYTNIRNLIKSDANGGMNGAKLAEGDIATRMTPLLDAAFKGKTGKTLGEFLDSKRSEGVNLSGQQAIDQVITPADRASIRQQAISQLTKDRGAEGKDIFGNEIPKQVSLVPEGSGEAFIQKFKDDWKKDIEGTNYAKEFLDKFATSLSSAAADKARGRKPQSPGTVSDDKGEKDPPIDPNKDKYEKMIQKLDNEIRSLLESTNPQIKATEELAHGQDILNAALATGDQRLIDHINKYGGSAVVMAKFREKLQDQLDPLGAVLQKLSEHSSALSYDTIEQEKNLAVAQAIDEVRKKQGGTISDAQKNQLTRAVEISQASARALKAEQAAFEAIIGPQRTYESTLAAISVLQAKGVISSGQYQDAVDKARMAFLEASGEAKTFSGGMESAWLQIKADVQDVGGTIKKTLVDAFQSVNDAIVQLVMTGTVDWHKMVDSMLEDMTRLILKQIELKAVQGVIGGIGGGAPLPGNQYGGSYTVPGFATGGMFTVGGAGSTDSKLVAFRATPGERVTVETPDQQKSSARSPGGGEFHAHMIVVSNQEDAAIAAMSTRRGSNVQIVTLQQNRRAVAHVTKR